MIWLLVRETVDWKNYTYAKMKQYVNQSTLYKKTVNSKIQSMHHWDKIFNLSYFEYRFRVKEIAKLSWEKLNCPIVERQLNLSEIQQDDIILATDDDDWLSSDVIDILPEFFQHHDIVCWPSLVNDMWTGDEYCWWKVQNKIICVNNWAVSGRLLKKLKDQQIKKLLYLDHGTLPIAIESQTNIFCISSHYLSCYNIHPGSLSNKYFGKVSSAKPKGNKWTKPYREEMFRLVTKLPLPKLL